MKKKFSIAVVGGGIGGCMAAIKASELENVEVHLFEKKDKILSGLPFCHLHSGGFLYPMISLDDSTKLLDHSLDFADFFEDCIDLRPTIVAYRKGSQYSSLDLIDKCELMRKKYLELCESKFNLSKFPLGYPDTYYSIYTQQDIIHYKKYGKLQDKLNNNSTNDRKYHDQYVEKFCEIINDTSIEELNYPFVSVMEPTILMDRVYNKINRILYKNGVIIHLNTNANLNEITKTVDYVINACGYESGTHADNVHSTNVRAERYIKWHAMPLLELKSSWIIRNDHPEVSQARLPEIAIIGERGTENGMIQISQCEENNIFQIHVMTNDCTIFDCVNDINNFCKEDLNIIKSNKIPKEIIDYRTKNGINRISKLFSCFRNSECNPDEDNYLSFRNTDYKMPCWGVQRIVKDTKSISDNSDNGLSIIKLKDNRVADIVFPKENYAEIQIIKGISSVTASDKLKYFLNSKLCKFKTL